MSQTSFLRLGKIAVMSSAVATSIHVYNVKTSPSKYELAALNLGFSIEQQKSILKISTMAGYFKPPKMWDDVNRSKIFDPNAENVFSNILLPVVQKAHADKADMKILNDPYLQNNLFGRSKNYFWNADFWKPKGNGIEIAQVEKWILYQAQNAEIDRLTPENWMEKNKVEFFDAANKLGLIDRIKPHHEQYDQAWIAGEPRSEVLTRLIDYLWTCKKYGIEIKGDVKVLSGARELWTEIDGTNPGLLKILYEYLMNGGNGARAKIDYFALLEPTESSSESIEDGIKYKIASELWYEIKTNPDLLKILYIGFANGVYIDNLAERGIVDIQDSKSSQLSIIENIKNGQYGDQKTFHILLESNNPYILCQGLATQRMADEALKKAGLYEQGYRIKIDAVGFANKQDVSTVFSEFRTYIDESYKGHIGEPENGLRFQSRDHNMEIPDMPVMGSVHTDAENVEH